MTTFATLALEFTSRADKAIGDLDKVERGADRAEAAAGRLSQSGRKLATDLQGVGRGARRATDDLERAALAGRRFADALMGIAAAVTVGLVAKIADEWSDLQSVVGAAIRDMGAAPDMMSDILRLANASYSPLEQTARGFAANTTALRELGYATQQQLDYTESLNHMLVLNAARGERAQAVQTALSRAMAVGRIQTDGLETVMANSSEVAEALARHLGVTTGQLRGLASEGTITGQVIAEALIGALEDVRQRAGDMPTLIQDGLMKIRNGLTAVIGRFDQALGASAALADYLNSISEWLEVIAQSDMGPWAEAFTDGVTFMGQALLVLAATRIPSALIALGSLVTTVRGVGAAFWVQYHATIALGAATTKLGAAMALAGGPLGVLAAGVAVLGLALYSARSNAEAVQAALASLDQSRGQMAGAWRRFYEDMSLQNAALLQQAGELQTANALTALNEAQEELRRAERLHNILWLGLGENDRVNRAAEDVLALQQAYAAASSELDAIKVRVEAFSAAVADGVAGGTDAAQRVIDQALEMERSFARRAELATLELLYGRQSEQLAVARARHARDDVQARLEAAGATQDIVTQTLAALDAADRAEAAARGWANMTEELRVRVVDVQQRLAAMANADVGEGFMARGIARLAQMAALAIDAGLKANPVEPVRVARTGGGGRSSAADEALREAEAIQDVIESLRDEISLIGASAEARRLHQALQQANVEIYSREGQQIAELVEELMRLEEMEAHANRGREAVTDLFMALGQGSDAAKRAIAQLLAEMARVRMMRAMMGLGEGGGFFGWLGGMLSPGGGKAFASGGVVSSPSLSAFSGGVYDRPQAFAFADGGVPGSRLGVFAEAGPEAIMPLKRGADGKLGVAASGDAGGSLQVDVRCYVDQDANWQATVERIAQGKAEEASGQVAKGLRKAMPGAINRQIAHPRNRGR